MNVQGNQQPAANQPETYTGDGAQDWQLLYENPLSEPQHIEGFRLEGDAVITFPGGRMRLENARSAEEGQQANFVLWCPVEFPEDVRIEWDFWPVREPGLCILFLAAQGSEGRDLFDPALPPRQGIYEQYHHGEMNALHISYFRRRWAEERQFHTCNLRKSYGFHLVAQGADPIPGVLDAAGPYRMQVVKEGAAVSLLIGGLPIFRWEDDGQTYGPRLSGGRIGLRQMAPLIADYANLRVYGRK